MHIPQKPYVAITTDKQVCHSGWPEIGQALKAHLQNHPKRRMVLTVECYPGTYASLDLAALKKALDPDVICQSDDLFLEEQALRRATPTPGPLSKASLQAGGSYEIDTFFDEAKLQALRQTIEQLPSGLILIHGVGAHHVWPADVLVYSDVSRWELVQRMRRQEVGNVGFSNKHIALQKRFARAYFVDWPVAEQIKQKLLPECHYYLEANNWQQPKLMDGALMRTGLARASTQPLFLAPFFDPEIWNLTDTESEKNLATSFDLHPNHDNFLLKVSDQLIEIPARNICYLFPRALLGEQNAGAFPFTLTHHQQLHKKEHLIFWHPDQPQGPEIKPLYQHFILLRAKDKATILAGFQEGIALAQKRQLLQQDVPSQKDWRTHLQPFTLVERECLSIAHAMIHSIGSHGDILRISRADEYCRQRIPQRLQDEAKIPMPPEQAIPTKKRQSAARVWSTDIEKSPVDQLFIVRQLVDKNPISIPRSGIWRVACHLRGAPVFLECKNTPVVPLHAGQLIVLPAGYQDATWYSSGHAELLLIGDQ